MCGGAQDLCNSSVVSGWFVEPLPPQYDPLQPDGDPVVVQIQYDGKQQHTVTLMGKYIFDANHDRALGARLEGSHAGLL